MTTLGPTALSHSEFSGRIGLARQVITPPVGIYARLWGSATHDIADGVHRPLLGSCVVFQDRARSTELVLLAMDLAFLTQEQMEATRAMLLNRFSLQPHQLSIHPSHSHGIPAYSSKHVDRPGGHLIEPYLAMLREMCATLVSEARVNCANGTLTWAYGKCSLAFNRDAIDAASGRDVCGLNPAEKADDTLLVGRITDEAGVIRGTLVNYACHPVSCGGANRLISPDYAGAMRELVERDTGGAPCIFLHGPSGDLTPRRSYEPDVQAADQNGRELGYAALTTLAGMFPPRQHLQYMGIEESGTPLGVWRLQPKPAVSEELNSKMVNTRLSLKRMPKAEDVERQLAAATENFEIERLERTKGRLTLAGTGQFHFTLWQLGDAFMVCVPTESYSQLQVDLRAQFPDRAIGVLNLCDGAYMYLPNKAAYQRTDVYPVRVALYESGSLEHVAELAGKTIAQMS